MMKDTDLLFQAKNVEEVESAPSNTDYSTKDLNLGAFLWCQPDTVFVGVTQAEHSRTVFFKFRVMLDPIKLNKLLMDHNNGQMTVEPLLFVSKQELLRDHLHNSLNRRGR